MSYRDACFAMREAIAEREEAIETLTNDADINTWIWDVPPRIQFLLGYLAGAQMRFKQARAEVLGQTIPQGMKETPTT